MNIGPRRRTTKKPPPGPAKCPFCGSRLPLGGDTCLKCQRQVITGQKLPLLRRIALVPTGKKMLVLCGVLAGLFALIVVVNLMVSWLGRPSQKKGPSTVRGAPSAEELTARRLINELLRSTDDAERARLGSALGQAGPAAVPLAIEALKRTDLPEGTQLALITALGELGDRRAGDLLAELMTEPPFRQAAMIGLAMIGDPRAAKDMLACFTEQVRQAALADALAKRALLPIQVDEGATQRRWADRISRLIRPVAGLGPPALPQLLSTYWAAWQWPMRDRGRYWLEQLDRVLAQMVPNGSADELLEGLLTGQSSQVRLASAMLLRKRQGSGTPSAERRAGRIADLLASSDLVVRQRAAWTLSALTDKVLGSFSAQQAPEDVGAEVLKEALLYAERRLGKQVQIDPSLLAQTKPPPEPTRREYHPARVEARRLVEGLSGADWADARTRFASLRSLPPDGAPVVRRLLEGDVRQLQLPARLVVLELLANWRDRASFRLMSRLEGLLDNPPWMRACIACAQASASRDVRVGGWLEQVARLGPGLLAGTDPARGFTPADLGELIAPLGRPALAAMWREQPFRGGDLTKVYHATVDAMVAYGWPVQVWLGESP
jgi:hypothetical protein